jgi:hypothetical protein
MFVGDAMATISSTLKQNRTFALWFKAATIAVVFAFIVGIFNPIKFFDEHFRHLALPDVTITDAELEEQYGIRVTLIAVTAAGGMVDLRIKVLDAEKANKLLGNHANMPTLLPDGSNRRLGTTGSHRMKLFSGKTYYMLYGNALGVVKPGTPVSVAFGNLILPPIPAK